MARQKHDEAQGPSQRQLRVAELIRRALSEIFARGDLHDPDLDGKPITVGEVRVSPDLRHATVFVLPLGGIQVDETLVALDRSRRELRRAVTAAVDLKFSPELKFQADTSFDQMDRTRALLSSDAVRRDVAKGGDS